jgi:hypothetical protein
LTEATTGLASSVKHGSNQSKAGALVELLKDRMVTMGQSWAVLARSSRTCPYLSSPLYARGLDPDVAAISSFSVSDKYDGLVLAGWPNDPRFRRLLNLSVSPEVIVLTYEFERKWFDRYLIKARQRDHLEALTCEQRAKIVQIPASRFSSENDRSVFAGPEPASDHARDEPVLAFEARVARRRSAFEVQLGEADELRDTHLVRFAGGCHAYLTEWAKLHVLNEVIERGESGGAKIRAKTVAEFVPGDFLLFRAAGDKEFVRLIAEEYMGAEEYGRQRRIAERWKTSLRTLGTSPSVVQRCLAEFGLERTSVTVGGWLGDPSKIGPGNDGDVDTIAKAAHDSELLGSAQEVTQAISVIRSAHLSAGQRLTRLILQELRGRTQDIRDEPTLFDLGYGEAWVVQVETIDAEAVQCPANKTNRLLWAADCEL